MVRGIGRRSRSPSLLELMERPLRRTVQVFHKEAANFRALVSYLMTQQVLPDELHCRMALLLANDALEICEWNPVQAILFQELYVSTIVDTTGILLEIVTAPPAAGTPPDPVLQYIQDTISKPGIALTLNTDGLLLRGVRLAVPNLDEAELHRQLDEITASCFWQPMLQRDYEILENIQKFRQRQLPVSIPVVHHDWSRAQRMIQNAVSLRDFREAYDNTLDMGNFPADYRSREGAFERWAERLKQNPDNYDDQALLSRIQTMRLFYFELYRIYRQGHFSLEEFRKNFDTMVHNGLVLCLRADRAYTLITQQLDWIGPNTRILGVNQCCSTIHPIYEWYIREFFTRPKVTQLLQPKLTVGDNADYVAPQRVETLEAQVL